MKAVILAGGIGSRMGEMCFTVPKPMLELCGKPILLHQIEALKKEGIYDLVIVTCYLSDKIEDFFGNGSEFGVNIEYYKENFPLGTAGALFRLDFDEDFLLCNGDLIFDIDINAMISYHKTNSALITLFAHPNSHPYDSLSLETDEQNRVTGIYFKAEKPEFYQNLCNAGIQIISPEILKMYNYTDKVDFDKDIVATTVKTGKVFAYRSSEYVHDIGTPERLTQAEKELSSGIVANKNKKNLQKAIFVDRDGTLNIHKGYISNPYDIELISGTEKAINTFHALGYLVIVITNQPVIARGECNFSDLKSIHNYLEMLLSESGAFVDNIYFCPHHPDKGFDGEIEELKFKCGCRKPSPGLILQAQKDFNIDLSKSYMIGDSIRDVYAGINAGCVPVFIGEETMFCQFDFDSLEEFSEYLKKTNQSSPL